MVDFHVDDKFGDGRLRFVNDGRRADLLQYQKGEGGAYINDYLTNKIFGGYAHCRIPKHFAQMILDDLGITRFENKEFVRINSNDELEGMRDEPMFTFLYLHDYTYYLYDFRG